MSKGALESLLATLDTWLVIFAIIVAIGVAGEAIFGFMHWRKSKALRDIQQTENLTLQRDIERAHREAAELRKAAEDERMARVKLQESIAWRSPSFESIKELSLELEKFEGQRYSVIFDANQPEQLFLFNWISKLLDTSKWHFETFGYGTELKFPMTNVVVWVTPSASQVVKNAAHGLVDALNRVTPKLDSSSNYLGGHHQRPPRPT